MKLDTLRRKLDEFPTQTTVTVPKQVIRRVLAKLDSLDGEIEARYGHERKQLRIALAHSNRSNHGYRPNSCGGCMEISQIIEEAGL